MISESWQFEVIKKIAAERQIDLIVNRDAGVVFLPQLNISIKVLKRQTNAKMPNSNRTESQRRNRAAMGSTGTFIIFFSGMTPSLVLPLVRMRSLARLI